MTNRYWTMKASKVKRVTKKQKKNYKKGSQEGLNDGRKGKYSVYRATFKLDAAYRFGYEGGFNKGATIFEKRQKSFERQLKKR